MYNDTSIAEPCSCVEGDNCSQTNCDCIGFCKLYIRDVKKWESPIAFTISPNPREYSSIDQLYKDWTEKFYKIQRHFDQLLVVAELSSQLHYHCIGVLKDPVGWTRHRYKLSLFHNFKVHKMFKNKLHYLFKDVVKTYNSLHKQVICFNNILK